MPLNDIYKTDTGLETTGIYLQLSETTRVKVCRAGSSNKRYAKELEKAIAPIRRAVESDLIDMDRQRSIIMEVFALTIVLSWEELVDGEWVVGISPEDAGLVESPDELLGFGADNVLKVFRNLPDVFDLINREAQKAANFRSADHKADAGN